MSKRTQVKNRQEEVDVQQPRIETIRSKPDLHKAVTPALNTLIEPEFVELQAPLIPPRTAANANNWSGSYATHPPDGFTMIVNASWVVPNVVETAGGLIGQPLATWIGLDNTEVPQVAFSAGVSITSMGYGGTYYPFYQWGSYRQVLSNLGVGAGDTVHVWAMNKLNGGNTVRLLFANVTTGAYWFGDITTPLVLIGATAEWVVSSTSASIYGIPRYGQVLFGGAWCTDLPPDPPDPN
ncbi:G1 family glutamic endopeptidase, partial [Streptomyces carpinensis]